MLPYFLCILPAFLFSLFQNQYIDDKKNRKQLCLLLLVPLFVLLAFKSASVGADTDSYNRMYLAMLSGSFDNKYSRIEIGYKYFLAILTHFSDNVQFQHIIYALVFVICMGYFIKKNSKLPANFIVLFLGLNLFSFYLTGIRQSLSMLICICAYNSIKEKKVLKFLLITTLAVLFHRAAIFFYPAYFIANLKLSKNKIFIYFILFGALALLNNYLFDTASEIFVLDYGVEKTNNGYMMFLIIAIITLLAFIKMKDLIILNPNNQYIIQLNVLHMGFWVLRLFSRTAERPSMYYTCFTILLVEQLILTIQNKKIRFVINMFVMAFFAAYFIYKMLGSGLSPYTFCW